MSAHERKSKSDAGPNEKRLEKQNRSLNQRLQEAGKKIQALEEAAKAWRYRRQRISHYILVWNLFVAAR